MKGGSTITFTRCVSVCFALVLQYNVEGRPQTLQSVFETALKDRRCFKVEIAGVAFG